MTRDRDQQHGGRHGGRQQSTSGRQEQGRDDDRRSLRDTYNHEPQWLRQDRENRGWGRDDADEYGQGRGSYAGHRDQQQGREYQGRDYLGRGEFTERNEPSQSRDRDFGNRYGTGGRDTQSGYGAQSRFSGGQEYGSGFETSGWDDDLDLSESQGRYEPFHVGTGMGLGPSGRGGRGQFGRTYGTSSGYGEGFGSAHGTWEDDVAARQRQAASHRDAPQYGGRSGYDLGTHQRDIRREPQRSFRGVGPQSYKRPDERIRDDIYERLTDDHHIDARAITVAVNEGSVTLTGTVVERRMRYAAEDLVEAVMGVANIDNQLRVQPESMSGGASMTGGGSPAGASSTGASPGGASNETKRH